MSSPRVQKIFEAMPNQLRRLGPYDVDFREAMRWQGRADATGETYDGRDSCVIDMDSATWSTGNKRLILVAEPASDLNNTEAMKTQSHAAGHFLDGSVRFHLYLEEPASYTDAQGDWIRNAIHHLRGQLAAPVKLWTTDNATEPALKGVNGEPASAAFNEGSWMLPYGMTYPGGV